ncbi:hypothetical protein ANCDUO_09452 [Ancylostoma duodenale]|uniref:Thrombospondin type 1 domain protein n=1 Tax=Ancylostoma duodenale TaxID=51022 RepID=A0A0C2CTR8_9BILA|nr:hypothetical protein ANCDUO_09452 [Ancylostoma duodenale]
MRTLLCLLGRNGVHVLSLVVPARECDNAQTVETCAAASCPVWSDWGPWEGCSLTCGQGQERRSRKCQVSMYSEY